MSVKFQHPPGSGLYFITFTCFNWLPLIHITNCYDVVYKWMNHSSSNLNAHTVAYVIMPNHVHVLIYLANTNTRVNKLISNAKRFIAYEIIKRLKATHRTDLLEKLNGAVSVREKQKGQLHKVFKDSFDAKEIRTEKFLRQKVDYIHHNPVKGKWNLAPDYTRYEHSSIDFYETGKDKNLRVYDYRLFAWH